MGGGVEESPAERHFKVGARRAARGRFEEAARAYRRAVRADPLNADYRAHLGRCLEDLGDLDGAALSYRRAAKAPGADPWLHGLSARALAKAGRTEEAGLRFQKAWASKPSGALAFAIGASSWVPRFAALLGEQIPVGWRTSALLHQIETALHAPRLAAASAVREAVEELAATLAAPGPFWLCLYAVLLARGYAAAALLAKQTAARVMREAPPPPGASRADVECSVAASCYVGDFARAHALADQASSRLGADAIRRCRLDILLMEGRVAEARRLRDEAVGDDDSATFRSLIQGKTCALVGPAVNDLRSGEAIDAHGFVARTNVSDLSLLEANRVMTGARADAAYYTSDFLQGRWDQVVSSLETGRVACAVVRHALSRRILRQAAAGSFVRRWLSYKKQNFIGIGFAMRHILYDLLLFADEPVSVYGADFFLGPSGHYPGYVDAGAPALVEYVRHDVFDCFMFMKRLSEVGAIRCDRVLSGLLADDLDGFADRITHRFLR